MFEVEIEKYRWKTKVYQVEVGCRGFMATLTIKYLHSQGWPEDPLFDSYYTKV